ncbi:hypothetical protein GO685_03385 [Wolbachia endosymbiont of Madathamugadia hiepei]|uniref:hypothetical protein n=1 Tax=Wolbachia endosymbiont of Madathamugadia hiepei TaxID=1241303 RepID=UPI001589D9AD|nr:hypothetical protein [Wolbachia endosymbiont of Madathamugadia hiepei]NUX01527.1 hypothetical protein [Wolbachia endosymbiont of Madathamugadia hiepei]
MVDDKITLNFEIERGEPIARQSHFFARIKLTNESKNLLREKFGSTVKFDNLDSYLDLNYENFYIYYNKYGGYYGRDELYVKNDDGRSLTSNLPLNHYGFSMELSLGEGAIADYGFYPLAVIYNPSHYDKAKEKVFDDHGELSPIASNVLDNFLSNTNGLATQDILLKIQNEIAEKEVKLIREKRQAEEELNQKNEELKELIEKDEIKIFKVIKGHDVGDGRSAVILQPDGKERDKIPLDSSKYYIAEYKHYPESEGVEYLHFIGPRDDMLVDYEDLFFVLNRSSYSGFESGFYSADGTDLDNYAKYSKDRYLGGDQLSERLSSELEEDSNQINSEVMLNDQLMNEEVIVESEAKPRKKRAIEEDDNDMKDSDSSQAKNEDQKSTTVKFQEDSSSKASTQELSLSEENEQEEVIIISVMGSMKDDKDPQHPLKIKTGEPIEIGKYKVELQVAYDDIRNFYNTILGKYQTNKEYSYEQVSVLYNGIIIPIHGYYDESFTLPEAYVTGGHLFIKDQDFGTLDDFNEMFYKSDELV